MTIDKNRIVPATDPAEPPVKPARGRVSRVIVWTNVALALVVIAPSFFGEAIGATGTTAQIGTLLLLLVLLPSNLLRFGWWGRKGWVRGLARLRKPLGIGSGIWFVAHSAVALVEYFDLREALVRQLLIGDMALGVVATLIFVALLITSTKSWQRALGANWKRLQRLVWFAIPLALAHTVLSSVRLFHFEPPGVLLLGVVLTFAVVEFFVLRTRQRARSNERRTAAWTHAGLVAAGIAVAALIYGASWIAVGPWQLTNDAPSEQSAILREAPPQPGL